MMSILGRACIALKALRELGPQQVGHYAWYQACLKSGYLKRVTQDRQGDLSPDAFALHPILKLPEREEPSALLDREGAASLFTEADEIVAGQVRLFGGQPAPLELKPPGHLAHWTEYESEDKSIEGETPNADIKLIWEPARFGWAYTLGRAYYSSGEERYAGAFWGHTETFLEANPPYLGPNWSSAQEAALRLIALVWAAQVLSGSAHSTPERRRRLGRAVAAHAARIPPTLAYARAQNNNHLLSEAAGLYTAGLALPNHPEATRWRESGWRWLNQGLQGQIAADGSYVQHSTNYQRLMLQVALWAQALGTPLPSTTSERLGAATRWLLSLSDPETGRVPNLGANDGAYIQPLTVCPFQDYRPVLQAAAAAFLEQRAFQAGPWGEMRLWYAIPTPPKKPARLQGSPDEANNLPAVLRSPMADTWGYLRAARFSSRPGHADQLHLDLWWRGVNLAQDPGTYLYNAPPPWDNALAGTCVHNTISLNGEDQMSRAGRFLYLDRAQAEIVGRQKAEDGSWERLIAQHDGYRRLGVVHQRSVTCHREGRWVVEDRVLPLPRRPSPGTPLTIRLHWLLPDWPWEVVKEGVGLEIRLGPAHGQVRLRIEQGSPASPSRQLSQTSTPPSPLALTLARAGERLHGPGPVAPIQGWTSPRYGDKIPALSLAVEVVTPPPFALVSEWHLTE